MRVLGNLRHPHCSWCLNFCLSESNYSSATHAKDSPESVCEVWEFCEHSLLQPFVQIVTASVGEHLIAGIAARWSASFTEVSNMFQNSATKLRMMCFPRLQRASHCLAQTFPASAWCVH